MRNLLLLITALFLFGGCSAKYHLKRAIAKGANVYVQKWDTTIVTKERTLRDTIEILRDTTIIQDGVVVDLQYKDRLIYVEAKCSPDTIPVTKYITKTVSVEENKTDYRFFWQVIFAASIIYLFSLLVRTRE